MQGGMTVQNLHCSSWRDGRDAAETLAGLRAAMAPGAELILESTPDGVGGCFHEEWENAPGREWCGTFFRGGWRSGTGQRLWEQRA